MLNLTKITIASPLLITLGACTSHAHQSNNPPPVGAIQSADLLSQFATFSASYHRYQVSEQDKRIAASFPDDLVIDVYFGTWCHDSQREVPRLLKSLGAKATQSINLIALDYKKAEPNGRAKEKGVSFTPTFIISRNGVEIGRIVERPEQSLMADIQAML